jgi:DNA invertase Pin-like site-specific DNA recombinase
MTRQIFAYLRVSTNDQDVENQKHGIKQYAVEKGFDNIEYIADSVSSKVKWQERKLGDMIKNARNGDVIIFSEISRMARSTLQVLEILRECAEKQIEAHIVKTKMIIDNSIQSKAMVLVYSLVAEMEKDFISVRTKEALARKKAEGVKLGRPAGKPKVSKLDKHKDKIAKLRASKVGVTDIAKFIGGVSRATVHNWLKENNL